MKNAMPEALQAAYLVQLIKDCLDEAAKVPPVGRLEEGGWTMATADRLRRRLGDQVECLYGSARSYPGQGHDREWLFDFCALDFDGKPRNQKRFMAQALIVGEMEFSSGDLDDDFEKILLADSVVCFFAFPGWVKERWQAVLSEYEAAAARRREMAMKRGNARPPVFVISCWVEPDERFEHRTVGLG